jgi:taurine dioxygenase
MPAIQVHPLRDDLGFGARVTGATDATLQDVGVRQELNAVFEDRGLIVFEGVEPTSRMHVTISNVFGPLKDHPVPVVDRVDRDGMPGVIEMKQDKTDCNLVEIAGRRLTSWIPWHFDHCYNDELNRAGVLRAVEIAAEGGLTGFADGRELYKALPADLRERIEGETVIYTLDLLYSHMRFGVPEDFRSLRTSMMAAESSKYAANFPRALHPAVWTDKAGQRVLHVSPWMAVGLEGRETAEGEALLEAVCQAIVEKVNPYFHHWKPTDMLIWDNWRMLHSVTGHDPEMGRCMHRTTIRGDYGLGRFENGAKGDARLEMTV